MFAKAFFPGGYFPAGYFPVAAAQPVGSPLDYDLSFHVGTPQGATFRMERMPRSLRAHVGNAQTVTLRD